MRKILIATHERYAEGIKAAAELILGPQPEVTTICAYTEDVSLADGLEKYFSSCMQEDQVIVLTDIYGGSVNQACMKYMDRPGRHLLTGLNLPLLLQVLTMGDTLEDNGAFQAVVKEAREQLSYVNDTLQKTPVDDFEGL